MEYSWFIVGLILIVLEMAMGSVGFYLVGVGCISIVVGTLSFISPNLTLDVLFGVFAFLTLFLCIFLFNKNKSVKANEVMSLDLNNNVKVVKNDSDGVEVEYRGSIWKARIEGTKSANDKYVVKEVVGNSLVIKSDERTWNEYESNSVNEGELSISNGKSSR